MPENAPPPCGAAAAVRIDDNLAAGETASEPQGHGLGGALMHARGQAGVWGDVLREKDEMLKLARELGGAFSAVDGASELVRASFDL